MRRIATTVVFVLLSASTASGADCSYLGFDRNDYPGDANLKTLHQTFSYTGYWLNNPPGATSNSWAGHRAAVESAGFGFLVLFNGRLYAQLKTVANATRLGKSDARAAVAAARRERLSRARPLFFSIRSRAAACCPSRRPTSSPGSTASRPRDFARAFIVRASPRPTMATSSPPRTFRRDAGSRAIVYWAINDGCPPAPGCAFPQRPPTPAQSGVPFAEVWQFAQSPQRKDVAGRCTNYSRDGNCNAPGVAALPIDLNTATSADPSHGRTR